MAKVSAAAYCFVAMPFMPATVATVMRAARARAANWVVVLVMAGSWGGWFGIAFRVPMDGLSEFAHGPPIALRRPAAESARTAIWRDEPESRGPSTREHRLPRQGTRGPGAAQRDAREVSHGHQARPQFDPELQFGWPPRRAAARRARAGAVQR